MCGIAGIWGDVDADRLRSMSASLRHRGPDDDSVWMQREARIGFAHRRLSIIDLDGGQQPITNEDGRIVTIFNGAIYNYRELRRELRARGHVFRTESDTEVIVHLYEEHGLDFVTPLRGMFAIGLWDDRERRLILVRDRAGKKPLYFSERNGEFLFASEIKGILAACRTTPPIDEQSLSDYLTWGVVPAPATIFQSVCSVLPAELLVVEDKRVVNRQTYWRLEMLPKTNVSQAEAVERTDALLQESVRLRLRADVPVAAFLSGGIDSGVVTAIAARQYPGRLKTITVGSEDSTFDERAGARLVAERYGTEQHEILIQPHVADDLPKILAAYDQPFADSSAIPSYYVARAARPLAKVVLNGDGGDEVFAGYRRYVAARINHLLSWLDAPAARRMLGLLLPMLPRARGYRSGYAFMHRLLRGLATDPVTRYLDWSAGGFSEAEKGKLWAPGAGRGSASWPPVGADRFARALLHEYEACGYVDRTLGADFRLILPNDLLVKMDIACMAHGLEGRSPLLDHVLVETAARFPEAMKLPGATTKPILRELSRRYVPVQTQRARKRGFEVPLVRWLRHDLRGIAEDALLSPNGWIAGRFDRRALERLLRNADGLDPARWSRRVWTLLVLAVWHRSVRWS